MSSPNCKSSLSHPAHGHLSAIDIEAEANPCPLARGSTSTHTTILDNQRTGSIYQVHISVKSFAKAVTFVGCPVDAEKVHIEPVVSAGKKFPHQSIMREHPVNYLATDEIETAITLYDSTQKRGNTFSPPPESASIKYTLDLV